MYDSSVEAAIRAKVASEIVLVASKLHEKKCEWSGEFESCPRTRCRAAQRDLKIALYGPDRNTPWWLVLNESEATR